MNKLFLLDFFWESYYVGFSLKTADIFFDCGVIRGPHAYLSIERYYAGWELTFSFKTLRWRLDR